MANTPTDPSQAQAWISGTAPDQTVDFYIPRGNVGPTGPRGPIGPSLIVGDVVTTTGPAAPGTVGPQGLQGLKGDPGGIVQGTIIANNTDWNNLITDGVYRCSGQSGMLNIPGLYPYGVLIVHSIDTGTRINQIFYPATTGTNGRIIWSRGYAGGVWSNWRTFTPGRWDTTAGRVLYQWDPIAERDQLVYGDTGWRALTLDPTYGVVASGDFFGAPNGNALASDLIKIRRVNNRVYIGGNGPIQPKQDYSSTTRNLCGIPQGFRSTGSNDYIITRYGNNGGDSAQRLVMLSVPADFSPANTPMQVIPLVDSNWNNFATGGTWPKQYGGIWPYGSWITNETWPTTLPGTAVGSIPNT